MTARFLLGIMFMNTLYSVRGVRDSTIYFRSVGARDIVQISALFCLPANGPRRTGGPPKKIPASPKYKASICLLFILYRPIQRRNQNEIGDTPRRPYSDRFRICSSRHLYNELQKYVAINFLCCKTFIKSNDISCGHIEDLI